MEPEPSKEHYNFQFAGNHGVKSLTTVNGVTPWELSKSSLKHTIKLLKNRFKQFSEDDAKKFTRLGDSISWRWEIDNTLVPLENLSKTEFFFLEAQPKMTFASFLIIHHNDERKEYFVYNFDKLSSMLVLLTTSLLSVDLINFKESHDPDEDKVDDAT